MSQTEYTRDRNLEIEIVYGLYLFSFYLIFWLIFAHFANYYLALANLLKGYVHVCCHLLPFEFSKALKRVKEKSNKVKTEEMKRLKNFIFHSIFLCTHVWIVYQITFFPLVVCFFPFNPPPALNISGSAAVSYAEAWVSESWLRQSLVIKSGFDNSTSVNDMVLGDGPCHSRCSFTGFIQKNSKKGLHCDCLHQCMSNSHCNTQTNIHKLNKF